MMICLATVFLLAAAYVWATYDPGMGSGESSELEEAYNSYNALNQQGRYSEAEPYAEEALRLVTEEFGPNDPSTAALLDNLALLYQAQGRAAEAEPLYRRALAIREEALGPEHPDVAGALAASDIVEIITTYHENESKFKRDYLGRTLTATMYFADAGGATFGGGNFVGFEGISGSAGLTCRITETLPNGVIDWEEGKSVSLTGVVYDVVISTLYLERCSFKTGLEGDGGGGG